MPSRIRPCRCRVNDFGADGVWARHTTTTDWFYTFDPQGCLSQKVGRDGSVLCSSIYDAQGHEATTDTHPDPFSGYGGQFGYYADWETSTTGGGSCLYLLGHRFYDPDAGRFINRDPIGYDGGINLYAYTGNNPVNRADPKGFQVDSSGTQGGYSTSGVGMPPNPDEDVIPPGSAAGEAPPSYADCPPATGDPYYAPGRTGGQNDGTTKEPYDPNNPNHGETGEVPTGPITVTNPTPEYPPDIGEGPDSPPVENNQPPTTPITVISGLVNGAYGTYGQSPPRE